MTDDKQGTLSTTASRQCAATTKAGTRCRAAAMTGAAYCFNHNPDPATVAARAAARSKGGRARHNRKLSAAGNAALDARLCLTTAQNIALALEASVASARALVYVAVGTMQLKKTEEIEDRLDALEAAQANRKGER